MLRNFRFRSLFVAGISLSVLSSGMWSCTTSTEMSRSRRPERPQQPKEAPPTPTGVQNTAKPGTTPTPQPEVRYRNNQDAPESGRYYQQARHIYDSGDTVNGLAQIQNYFQANPQGQFADEAAFLLAKQAFDKGDFESAASYYNKIAELNPPSKLRGDAIYLNALSLYNLFRRKEALASLARVEIREVSAPNRLKLFMLWGKVAGEEGRALESTLAFVKAHRENVQQAEQKEIEQVIEEQIENRLSEAELNFVLQEYPVEFPAGQVQMKLVTLRLAAGQRPEALNLLQNVLATTSPASAIHAKAQQALARLRSAGDARVTRIGALLPLSGESALRGKAVIEGLQMSLNQMSSSQQPLELVQADAGATEQSAAAAFERLVLEEKVMAVVGPIAGPQAEVVADKAVELGVPLITLAARPGLLQKGPFVFRLALTPERQVRALVGYARDRLNAKRFAIMFPEDYFGREYANEYFEAVHDFGGEVTAAESYNPTQADFKVQLDNMLGLGFPAYRQTETSDAAKDLETKLQRKPTKKELEQVTMPPIVDFDVMFIPDVAKPVGFIAAALAREVAYSTTKPQLMGPSTWNRKEILSRGGDSLSGALFVDAFSPERQSKVTQEFVEKYQVKSGHMPNLLVAQGYDVGLALKMAYGSGKIPESRDELRSRLEVLGSFDGSLGMHTWDSRREALSELQLFQIKKAAFVHQGGISIKARKAD